jgi:hypothetical protein
VPEVGFWGPSDAYVLPGTALARGLQGIGDELDFFSMPRVPEFAELEDGEVGYNFASIPSVGGEGSNLVDLVRRAATHVASCEMSGGQASSGDTTDPSASHLFGPSSCIANP